MEHWSSLIWLTDVETLMVVVEVQWSLWKFNGRCGSSMVIVEVQWSLWKFNALYMEATYRKLCGPMNNLAATF